MSSVHSDFENVLNYNLRCKIGWDIWERVKGRNKSYIDFLKQNNFWNWMLLVILGPSQLIFKIMVWINQTIINFYGFTHSNTFMLPKDCQPISLWLSHAPQNLSASPLLTHAYSQRLSASILSNPLMLPRNCWLLSFWLTHTPQRLSVSSDPLILQETVSFSPF